MRSEAFLMPASSPVLLVVDLDLPALALAVARVHAQEHRGPVHRLGAAGARVDVDEAVGPVLLAREHPLQLELRDVRLERGSDASASFALSSSLASAASSKSALASSRPRCVFSKAPTLDSSVVFSFSIACALTLSFQKSGSVDSRSISAMRVLLRSTSKRPPERQEALPQAVDLLRRIVRHGCPQCAREGTPRAIAESSISGSLQGRSQ